MPERAKGPAIVLGNVPGARGARPPPTAAARAEVRKGGRRSNSEIMRSRCAERQVVVIDGSAFPKKGTESCGVGRQWCGRLGKVDNCQVGVFLAYAARAGYAPLDRRLYLPEDWADDDTLAEMDIEPPDTLYGLYRGTDLTRRDTNYGNVLPDVIAIYQGPIQEDCETVEEMEELVRDTVVHEVGHYFGLDDDRLAELEDDSAP